MDNEIKRQINALWKKTDNTEDVAKEALILAKHADKGYIEAYTDLKSLRGKQDDMQKTLNVLKADVESIPSEVRDKLNSNLKWTITLILGLLTAYSGIIIFILNHLIK